MPWWVWTILLVYVIGFLFVLFVNLLSGPITPGLALLRAVFWFIWIPTGWPHGTPLPMD